MKVMSAFDARIVIVGLIMSCVAFGGDDAVLRSCLIIGNRSANTMDRTA